jgi:hypothetical protein
LPADGGATIASITRGQLRKRRRYFPARHSDNFRRRQTTTRAATNHEEPMKLTKRSRAANRLDPAGAAVPLDVLRAFGESDAQIAHAMRSHPDTVNAWRNGDNAAKPETVADLYRLAGLVLRRHVETAIALKVRVPASISSEMQSHLAPWADALAATWGSTADQVAEMCKYAPAIVESPRLADVDLDDLDGDTSFVAEIAAIARSSNDARGALTDFAVRIEDEVRLIGRDGLDHDRAAAALWCVAICQAESDNVDVDEARRALVAIYRCRSK